MIYGLWFNNHLDKQPIGTSEMSKLTINLTLAVEHFHSEKMGKCWENKEKREWKGWWITGNDTDNVQSINKIVSRENQM